MAQKQIVEWIDDLTGSKITDGPGSPTVPFSVDGAAYEIDLGKDSRQALQEALAPFIRAARKVPSRVTGSRIQAPPRQPAKIDPTQKRDIRNWWAENQKTANLPKHNTKGRIPEVVMSAYQEHGGKRVHPPVPMPFAS
ncbi:Lsr2 family protein [Micromonospora sp. NPDC049366]|uniref:Lsr2 family protein n=1 Tax=Micromonospora sp. NPDC049366 TaxID=3364271 RepID=UPI0037AAEA2F